MLYEVSHQNYMGLPPASSYFHVPKALEPKPNPGTGELAAFVGRHRYIRGALLEINHWRLL